MVGKRKGGRAGGWHTNKSSKHQVKDSKEERKKDRRKEQTQTLDVGVN